MNRKSKGKILFIFSLIFVSVYLIFVVDWVGYEEITENIFEQNEVQLYEGQELTGVIHNVKMEASERPSMYPIYLYYDLISEDIITESPNPTGFGLINDETEIIFESGKITSELDELLRYLYFGMRVETVISIEETYEIERVNNVNNPHFIKRMYLFDDSKNNEAVSNVLSEQQHRVTLVSFFDKKTDTHSFLQTINRLYPGLIGDVQFYDVFYANTLAVLEEYDIKETPTVAVFGTDGLLYQTDDSEQLYDYLSKLSN
ncbi:hypothetical protein [Alkalihalobacterium bogoriense]|uniref:hypothetical protein n=1 Tax=Alkalihalobacterium bogoriense TaxID=246272 RepID=UPI00047CD99B|nr:hypothetical protein [Alkalihalobacterium bogoriense]